MKLSLIEDNGQHTKISITGPITQREFLPLQEPLSEVLMGNAFSRPVLLDLSEVTHVDSSGIGWMLACHKQLRQAGGKFIIHSCPPLFTSVAKVLRLEQILEIAPDAKAAVESANILKGVVA